MEIIELQMSSPKFQDTIILIDTVTEIQELDWAGSMTTSTWNEQNACIHTYLYDPMLHNTRI